MLLIVKTILLKVIINKQSLSEIESDTKFDSLGYKIPNNTPNPDFMLVQVVSRNDMTTPDINHCRFSC